MAHIPTGRLKAKVISAIRGNRAALSEITLFIGAYLVYLLTNGLVHADTRAVGVVNGEKIVSLQRDLGFLWEPGWQSWALENVKALVVTMNWVYIITYWPVILLAALVLFVKDREKYHFYRTVVFINLAGALVTFMLFPVASPFAIPSIELLDTIQEFGPRSYGSEDMASLYNISAAMPSLHFSWTVILGVLFWRSFRGRRRFFGLLYPVLTFFAIVLTGNHFILDAVAGGVLAGLAFGVVWLLRAKGWPAQPQL
ncbi:MAG: phosphatase PAP2 family protein [Chloroflexi bacterium]|nr:phosphatase PAP2 family protein [Chloroflexota bacterium]